MKADRHHDDLALTVVQTGAELAAVLDLAEILATDLVRRHLADLAAAGVDVAKERAALQTLGVWSTSPRHMDGERRRARVLEEYNRIGSDS